MDVILKAFFRLIGTIAGIILLLAFILPLIAVFLVLFVLQTLFHIKFVKTQWIRPLFGIADPWRKKAKNVPDDGEVIDVEVVEVPDDDVDVSR